MYTGSRVHVRGVPLVFWKGRSSNDTSTIDHGGLFSLQHAIRNIQFNSRSTLIYDSGCRSRWRNRSLRFIGRSTSCFPQDDGSVVKETVAAALDAPSPSLKKRTHSILCVYTQRLTGYNCVTIVIYRVVNDLSVEIHFQEELSRVWLVSCHRQARSQRGSRF